MTIGDHNLTKKGLSTKTESCSKVNVYQNIPSIPSISLKLNEEIISLLKNRPFNMKLSINRSQNNAVSKCLNITFILITILIPSLFILIHFDS